MEEDLRTPSGSFDEAVSSGGRSTREDDDEDFYVPERRPSLDLGKPTGDWQSVEQATTPVLSYTSMKSNDALDERDDVSFTSLHLERTDSYSSCYSMDSDDCEKRTRRIRSKENCVSQPPGRPELIRDPNEIRHPALTVDFTFKALSKTLQKLSEDNLRTFKVTLWKHYPEAFSNTPQDMVDLVDRLLECYDLEGALQLTKALLREMELTRLVDYLQDLCILNEVRHDLKKTLKKNAIAFLAEQGEKHFTDVFNDVYISSQLDNGPNIEHEVLKIAKMNSNRRADTLISAYELMSPEQITRGCVRCVLVTGMPGTGKSMMLQRYILHWVEQQSHPQVSLVFPLPLAKINEFKDAGPISLLEIVNRIYPETKKLKNWPPEGKVMFICDGLDEYPKKLEFRNTESRYDYTVPMPLDVLVVNLIKGYFNGMVWVTTRPLSSDHLPLVAAHRVLELRGFTEKQKEEYFRRKFKDQADRVVAHLKSCKTLYVMCHQPLFCYLLSVEFQRAFREHGPEAELPRNITYMFTKLLLALINSRSVPGENLDFLMKLGKIAFTMLEKAQLKMTKANWKDSVVDIQEAIDSGLCTDFVIEKFILSSETVYCFSHSTIQEYMAAFYVFLSFRNHGKNALEQPIKGKMPRIFKARSVFKIAVERSLHFQDGRLDVFLRFLVGMTLKSNQKLLQKFISEEPCEIEDIAVFIRKRMSENQHPGRIENLQHCLEELGVGA